MYRLTFGVAVCLAMNTLLGIGKSNGSVRYQDVVGDTSRWREEHMDQILAMVRPDRLRRVKTIVAATDEDIFDVIAELRKRTDAL